MSALPVQVRRRDGSLASFDASRIKEAVLRAAREVGRPDRSLADEVTGRVVDDLAAKIRTPGVEQIQDAVERALMADGLDDVARAYIVYRRRRAEEREAKQLLGVRDELKLSVSAAAVLAERYLRRDEQGRIVESTGEMMDRTARQVAGRLCEF